MEAHPETDSNDTTYEDILLERRQSSDLRWAAREWEETVSYKYRKEYNKAELFSIILKSDRVTSTIDKLSSEGHKCSSLKKRAISILEDMNHTLDISTIRTFGVVLPKIMKKIYNKILVNKSGINKLKEIIEDTPVLLLPTHRSYADFLLISYLAFHYNLPFPIIAAGMDFMSMAFIGDMLRGSGAFYIRRSFMDDGLYWAIFQEYVQFHICKFGHPIEFFLEGTRSRSGKSLPPKIGLLGCITECWLRGKLPDISILPISISYNRTLEEKLFAYEMLGVPKPKESTSGLLKAMKILKECFGNIYVHFGSPISVSQFMNAKVDRHLISTPVHLTPIHKRELDACEELGFHVLRKLQRNSMVSIWSLACVSFLRCMWTGVWSISFQHLLNATIHLSNLASAMGAVVEGCQIEGYFKEHLRKSLQDHKDTVIIVPDDCVEIQLLNGGSEDSDSYKLKAKFTFNPSTVGPAVTHLLIQYYVNQTLHLFVRKSLVSLAAQSYKENEVPLDYLFSRYSLLTSIFANDFIFEPGLQHKDMLETLSHLSKDGCLSIFGSSVHLIDQDFYISGLGFEKISTMDFYISLLHPFILNYQSSLCIAETQEWESEAAFLACLQSFLENNVKDNFLYSALSQDTCKHSFKMLIKMGAFNKSQSSNGNCMFVPDLGKISCLKEALKPSLIVADQIKPKL